METQPKLRLALRNYLVSNQIPLTFINFKESMIEEMYDGRHAYDKNYQILVLEKPSSYVFELEPKKWNYESEKVLLIFNCSTESISFIPLDFMTTLYGEKSGTLFSFSNYTALKITNDHILVTCVGRKLKDTGNCIDIALFTTKGDLVSVWKMDGEARWKMKILDFHQLNSKHWLARLEIMDEDSKEYSFMKLCLLSTNRSKAYGLSSSSGPLSNVGMLIGTEANKIKVWFSEEKDEISEFFVLASSYQLCVYRYFKIETGETYDGFKKIADTKLDDAFLREIKVEFDQKSLVILSDDESRSKTRCICFSLFF